jgi:hypothetical protein
MVLIDPESLLPTHGYRVLCHDATLIDLEAEGNVRQASPTVHLGNDIDPGVTLTPAEARRLPRSIRKMARLARVPDRLTGHPARCSTNCLRPSSAALANLHGE